MTWSYHLTPSELVLVNGDRIVRDKQWWSTEEGSPIKEWDIAFTSINIPGTKEYVSSHRLGPLMAVVAILANEDVGAIGLAEKSETKFFGLWRSTTMVIVPQSQSHAWPVPSLESAFCSGSRTPSPNVRTLLYEWLGKSSADPWEALIRRVESYLVERGLLIETRKETGLRRAEYTPSDRADARVEESVIHAIRELVNQCRNTRPDTFSVLDREIGRAVSRREQHFSGS